MLPFWAIMNNEIVLKNGWVAGLATALFKWKYLMVELSNFGGFSSYYHFVCDWLKENYG